MIDNKPILVSVVIPTYNHGNFLKRAINSVIGQTYQNWEIIIIDNYSIDDTEIIVNSFSDPRINFLKIHNYGVIALSRNMGIRASKGEWVAFLDSDDYWKNDKLQECIDIINDKVDLIYHDLDIKNHGSALFQRKKTKSRQVRSPVTIDLLTRGNTIVNSSVMVRKFYLDQIGGISESDKMIAAEDFNTWLRISQLTEYIVYLPKTLGVYLIHDEGISRKDMSESQESATAEFIHILNSKQKIKLRANIKYTRGRYAYLKGDYKAAKKDLWFVLCHGRLSLRIKSIIMLVVCI
jgi:glycosyltransferase involved in cell wall biosynthesis